MMFDVIFERVIFCDQSVNRIDIKKHLRGNINRIKHVTISNCIFF